MMIVHEMSLVRSLVETVAAEVEKSGAQRATSICLTIGQGRDIVPELFDGLFAHLSRGTAVEGAELVIENTPYLVHCMLCGAIYHLDAFDRATWDCPRCDRRSYEVVSGMEFDIDSVEVV